MAQQEKNIANGKDQKILQHDIEEIDKKVEEVQQLENLNKDPPPNCTAKPCGDNLFHDYARYG